MKKYLKTNLNQGKLFLLFILGASLWIGRSLPYLNLFLDVHTILIVLFIASVLLFKLSSRLSFTIGIISLLLSFPWLITGNRVEAEGFGIFAFFPPGIYLFIF